MGLFGRKKEKPGESKQSGSEMEEIKKAIDADSEMKEVRMSPHHAASHVPSHVRRHEETPGEHKREDGGIHVAAAPIFVKIDRYRNILTALGHIKTSMIMIKNSFETLNELEKSRHQISQLMYRAMSDIDKRLTALDHEFLKPAGFHDFASSSTSRTYDEVGELQDVESVKATLADLKGQIEQMRAEIEKSG